MADGPNTRLKSFYAGALSMLEYRAPCSGSPGQISDIDRSAAGWRVVRVITGTSEHPGASRNSKHTITTSAIHNLAQLAGSPWLTVPPEALKLDLLEGRAFSRRKCIHEATKKVPQRDAVATDESAADKRADAQIDRSSSASDACTIH
eukprot:3957590-Pleurochrysis_carterae.AAC.1